MWQYVKPFLVGRFFDHFYPQSNGRGGGRYARAAITSVSPQKKQLRGPLLGFSHYCWGSGGVLHSGWLHLHGQQQAQRVHYDMSFTPSYLLTSIIAETAPLFPPV